MVVIASPAPQADRTTLPTKPGFSLTDLQGSVDDPSISNPLRALRQAAANGDRNVDEGKAKNITKK